MATLFLFRGLPGSGKTTVARSLGLPMFAADDFFYKEGEYRFDPSLLGEAHAACQAKALESLTAGKSTIVHNTFTQHWELEPYLKMAQDLGARVKVMHVVGEYKSVHGVPQHAIEAMQDRWESFQDEEVYSNTPQKIVGRVPMWIVGFGTPERAGMPILGDVEHCMCRTPKGESTCGDCGRVIKP